MASGPRGLAFHISQSTLSAPQAGEGPLESLDLSSRGREPSFMLSDLSTHASYLMILGMDGYRTALKSLHLELAGLAVVIMGVSGSGKSTVGEMLSKELGCSFLEADDFHTQSNKDKMSKGIPLSDSDRFPWLQALRDATMEHISGGETVVLTCSALQNKYREVLRTADPEYEPGSYSSCRVKFVCMEAPACVIADRIERRSTEGKHFMPSSLLQSQLDLLQIDEDEDIIRVDATQDLDIIIDVIKDSLKGSLNCSR